MGQVVEFTPLMAREMRRVAELPGGTDMGD